MNESNPQIIFIVSLNYKIKIENQCNGEQAYVNFFPTCLQIVFLITEYFVFSLV